MLCVVKRFGCVFILSADVNKCNKQGSSFIGLAIIRDERPKWTHHWHIRDGYSSATDCITLHTNRLTRLITGLINKDSVMYFIICKRQWSWRWCSGRTCHECVSWSLSTQTFSQHQVWLRLLFLLNFLPPWQHTNSMLQSHLCISFHMPYVSKTFLVWHSAVYHIYDCESLWIRSFQDVWPQCLELDAFFSVFTAVSMKCF